MIHDLTDILVGAKKASVSPWCRVLGISRSGLYAARQQRQQPAKACPLAAHASAAFEASGRSYGSRRLNATLKAHGLRRPSQGPYVGACQRAACAVSPQVHPHHGQSAHLAGRGERAGSPVQAERAKSSLGAHAPPLHRAQAHDVRHQVRGQRHDGAPAAGRAARAQAQRCALWVAAAPTGPVGGCVDGWRRTYHRGGRCFAAVSRVSMPPGEQLPPASGNPGASFDARRRPRQHRRGADASAARGPCDHAVIVGSAARPHAEPLGGPGDRRARPQ